MTIRIVAMGGGGCTVDPADHLVDDYILSLAQKQQPKVCFLPTASGDAPRHVVSFYTAFAPPRAQPTHLSLFNRTVADIAELILAQDVVYVGGGNTANMMAVWRVHGLDVVLREAAARGVVLGGVSAGGACWMNGCITDSFGAPAPLVDGLALVDESFCPHYDSEIGRRPAYHALVGRELGAGYAAEENVGLSFADGKLVEVVSSRRGAAAYRVERSDDEGATETRLDVRYLGA